MVLTPTGLRVRGRRIPCTIGRGGVVALKREGDGGTPVGILRVTGMAHRADRMAPPAPWSMPIGPRDLWCDDPGSPLYNRWTRASLDASAERMRRADRLYDLVLLTDWNGSPPVPGRGSAIFLHRWRRPGFPTEGCIAMAPEDLRWVARRVRRGTRIVVPEAMALDGAPRS